MQNTAAQLKNKLLRALDDDYNVVDMSTVLEVISRLETIPVTRETLEQTRLGKYVNEMRRKTSSKELAKQAKNLVRKWKQLVENQASGDISTASSVNGDSVANVGNGGSVTPANLSSQLASRLMAGGRSKPASPISRPGTPSSINSSRPVTPSQLGAKVSPKNFISRPTTPAVPYKPISPALQNARNKNSPALPSRIPASPKLDTPRTSRDTDPANKRKRRFPQGPSQDEPEIKKMSVDNVVTEGRGNGHYPEFHGTPNGLVTGKLSSSCDISQQNKGLGSRIVSQPVLHSLSKSPELKQTISLKRNTSMMDAQNSGAAQRERLSTPISKTPKVKTTAQLIEGLKASGGLTLNKSSETVNRIANNQIDKEEDSINQSVVPAAALPRPRRKPGTPIVPPSQSDRSLQETKTELVKKFLQTSLTPSSSETDLVSPFKMDSNSRTESPTNGMTGSALFGSLDNSPSGTDNTGINQRDSSIFDAEAQPVMFFIGDEDIKQENELARQSLEPASSDPEQEAYLAALARDPWSFMPPLNEDELDWTSLDYEPSSRPEVTDEMVENMSQRNWEGVNGMTDYHGDWRKSTETLSLSSYKEDLIHILPYVDLE